MSTAIRVLVISPRTLVRAGLGALLRGQPQIQVVGQVDDAHAAADLPFDVALLDECKKPLPLPFKFLALLSDPNDARFWLDAGAAGIVLETASVEELLSAIRKSHAARFFFRRRLPSKSSRRSPRGVPSEQPIEPLTDREREALQLLARGLSNKVIAQKLYLQNR